MPVWLQTAISIVVAALASTGLWTFISKRMDAQDARSRMILGLGHDRILALCAEYLTRGYVTRTEYENLDKYLYKPYIDLGGNGTVQHMKAQVDKLPIKEG